MDSDADERKKNFAETTITCTPTCNHNTTAPTFSPCPHCGLLGNKTQKGFFTSTAQRAAHIYRCAAAIWRATAWKPPPESDSSSSTPAATPPLSIGSHNPITPPQSPRPPPDDAGISSTDDADSDTGSTTTAAESEDDNATLTCPGCGAVGPKTGGLFVNQQALAGHMGKCATYKEIRK